MNYVIGEPPLIGGLDEDCQEMFSQLWTKWASKVTRNRLRMKYYDGKNRLKSLGIAIPPSLENIETVVGWPAKAVNTLAARSRFDGFVFAGDVDSRLESIVKQNGLKKKYRQLVKSELQSACAFLTISKGDEGEPDVIISAYSALNATALWDSRKDRIKCGLTIVELNSQGRPSWMNLYTDDAIIALRQPGNAKYVATAYPHSQGRPLMEPVVYQSSIDRPFGRSRISRTVMSLTDSAVRTSLRSEIGAEFFTAPQKYLLGADDSVFDEKPQWEAYIGSIFSIGKDADGELPKFGQLTQGTMQPHIEQMRSLAAQFSGETSVPISSLGVIHDNPSSAEAIYAAKEDLVIEATDLNEDNGAALETIGRLAMAIVQDKTIDDLTVEELTISAKFTNPAMPSVVSQSDAMVKQVAAIPWIGETDVALEQLGYTDEQIMRMKSDKKKIQAMDLLNSISETKQTNTDKPVSLYKQTSILNQLTRNQITENVAIRLLTGEGMSEEEAKSLIDENKGAQFE